MKTSNSALAALSLLVATGSGLSQPLIVTQPRAKAVAVGVNVALSVSASGTAPLAYQWRLDGNDLMGATNSDLSIPNVQTTNVGGYTVAVTNLDGAVISQIAQLSVARGDTFTDTMGTQLPYRLFLPPKYDSRTVYPLVLFWHGVGEVGTDNQLQLKDQGQFSFLSASNVAKYPCFYLAPQLPHGPSSCQEWGQFTDCATNLLRHLQAQFSIDSDRVYGTGLSMGGYSCWYMLVRYPDLLAAVVPMSGGSACHTIQDFLGSLRVPVWNFHSANDTVVPIARSDTVVDDLRGAGASVIYTRYQTGGHGIWPTAYSTPGLVDWVMTQQRGLVVSNAPCLSITTPTAESSYSSSLATLDLTGSAGSLDQLISRVDGSNTTTHTSVMATGTDQWSVTNLALAPPGTNVIIVTATAGSGSAALGGNTTFNDTLLIGWQLVRPVITRQPSNQRVRAGTTASFAVAAYSSQPMTYQWQFNTTRLADATNASLLLTNVQGNQAGTYTVEVADSRGSVTSAPAVLRVVFDPVIVQQPCNGSVPQFGSAILSVAVTNTATLPIGYRWRRGTTTLTNIVSYDYVCFLTLANLQTTTNYNVVLTNAATMQVSSNAWVRVLADADGDGLPDQWEMDHGISQTTANHGLADDDQDGLTNRQECEAGTDPTNSLSYLKVERFTVGEGGSKAVLQFFAVSNQTYTIQYRSTLNPGDWRRLSDVVATAANRLLEVTDVPDPLIDGTRFYRVVTPRQPE